MLRKTLALAAAALLCMGASPKQAAHPRKPASAGAATPQRAGPFDARDPASLIALLASLDARAEVARREGDAVFLTVTSPVETFSAQFAGCDAKGHGCQALLLDRQGAEGAPTAAQINGFNQTSVMCRVYQDKTGRPHVEYSTLLFPRDGRAEMLMHLNAWRGCIGDFAAFLKDPAGYLASAA